jgi:hypothetical protein
MQISSYSWLLTYNATNGIYSAVMSKNQQNADAGRPAEAPKGRRLLTAAVLGVSVLGGAITWLAGARLGAAIASVVALLAALAAVAAATNLHPNPRIVTAFLYAVVIGELAAFIPLCIGALYGSIDVVPEPATVTDAGPDGSSFAMTYPLPASRAYLSISFHVDQVDPEAPECAREVRLILQPPSAVAAEATASGDAPVDLRLSHPEGLDRLPIQIYAQNALHGVCVVRIASTGTLHN